jgi:hypothetical protein
MEAHSSEEDRGETARAEIKEHTTENRKNRKKATHTYMRSRDIHWMGENTFRPPECKMSKLKRECKNKFCKHSSSTH